jgi:hypothetical protein
LPRKRTKPSDPPQHQVPILDNYIEGPEIKLEEDEEQILLELNNDQQESTMNKTQRGVEPPKKRPRLTQLADCSLSQCSYNLRPRDKSLSQMSTTSKMEIYVPPEERDDLSQGAASHYSRYSKRSASKSRYDGS